MIVNKDCGLCKVITYAQHVGIDSLDKYQQAEADVVGNLQEDYDEQEACKDDGDDEQEATEPKKKRKRRRALNQSLEDGEGKSFEIFSEPFSVWILNDGGLFLDPVSFSRFITKKFMRLL